MQCFHWTNIQPMWGPENIAKSDKYTEEELQFQQEKVNNFKSNYAQLFNMTEQELESELGPQILGAFQYHLTEETHVTEPQGNLVEATSEQSDIAGHGENLKGLGNQQPSPLEYYYDLDDLDL